MLKFEDGSIEFRYSVSKLITRVIFGAALAVIGIISTEIFVSYLEQFRIEMIIANMEQGIRTPVGDPVWAVLIQMGLIFLVAYGFVRFSLSLFYLLPRQRGYMRVGNEGITYYKFKFSIKKTPHVEENFIDWSDFFDITIKKGAYFNDVLAFSKTEMSSESPGSTIDVTIKYAEDGSEDILNAINAFKLNKRRFKK